MKSWNRVRIAPTCPSKKMDVDLLQQVDGEGVDLR